MINTILNAVLGDFRGLAHDGDINRWHCHAHPALRNSWDTVEGHTARVEIYVLSLSAALGQNASVKLFKAMRNHDLPFERIMGDWPAKLTRVSPAARWFKRLLEWKIARDLKIRWKLTRQEALILSLCDTLDAALWARDALTEARDLDYWREYFAEDIYLCADKAVALGPEAQVWLGKMLAK